jgi:hypothetical protein
VLAINTKNYAFIQELIKLWFKKYQDSHHLIVGEEEEDEDVFEVKKKSAKTLKALVGVFVQPKISPLEIPKISNSHGCTMCSEKDICLFKPDWKDKSVEKYFLNLLIIENEQLAYEILNTFIKSDSLNIETSIYLDHIEPCEEFNSEALLYQRPLTPAETIYIYKKMSLVTHPVVKTLIAEKYYNFAQVPFWVETFRNMGLLILWLAFAVMEYYSIRHYYSGSNQAGKIILLILVILFFCWDVIEECRQIYYIMRRVIGYKKWVKSEYKEYKHNDSRKTYAIGQTNKSEKYSLINKEARIFQNLPQPYKSVDNVLDWMTILLQFISLLIHFIDIGNHTDTIARVSVIFAYLTVILVWVRQLLTVNGFFPGIDLVCMLRLLGPYILKFGSLYSRILIPFFLLFWAMFDGLHIPQSSMFSYWKECETYTFNLPYKGVGAFNSSGYADVCKPSLAINGFANFYDTLFTVFQMIFVNLTDFDTMKKVQNEMAPILIAIFVILNGVIGLNFFIGLMSGVLSGGAHTEAHKSMVNYFFYLIHCSKYLIINGKCSVSF